MVINMNTITTTICPKIDIHSHIIYDVDDGSKDFETTKEALKNIKKYNIQKIVCTPHFEAFCNDSYDKLINNFKFMKKGFKSHDVDIYLGFEFKLNYENIGILKSSNYTRKYILVELDRHETLPSDVIIEMLGEVNDLGYKIIFAHPEFYKNYRKIKFIKQLRENDIIIQIDGTSLLKKYTNKKIYRFSKKLVKKGLVDIVASDYHDNKNRSYESFEMSYNFVKSKYGEELANELFYENPKIIIDSF